MFEALDETSETIQAPPPANGTLTIEMLEAELPTDSKGLYALWRVLYDARARNAEEKAKLEARKQAVSAAIQRLANGTPAPTLGADDYARQHQAFVASDTRIADQLDLLKIAQGRYPEPPIYESALGPTLVLSMTPKDALLIVPSIRDLFSEARKACAGFEIYLLENQGVLEPRHRALWIREKLPTVDSATAKILAAELDRCDSPSAPALAARAQSEASNLYRGVKAANLALLDAAIAKLIDWESLAMAHERNWCDAWELPTVERTELSKRYTRAISELRSLRDSVAQNSIVPNGPGAMTPLRWFGLEKIWHHIEVKLPASMTESSVRVG